MYYEHRRQTQTLQGSQEESGITGVPFWLSGNKLASIHEDAGLIPALLSGFRIWHCCELQYKPATAAPIRPLAWEPPYATGVSLKRKKKKKVESQTSFLKCGVKF